MSPSQRYIAFLRAINVGGHVVKMDRLRALFEALGFANVATFIASGNVIFEAQNASSQDLEAQIEQHLLAALGYEIVTFIRTAGELGALARYSPFPPVEQDAAYAVYVSFLKAPLSDHTRQKLLALETTNDVFHAHERELFWLRRQKLDDSPLASGALLAKTMSVPSTMRNITTVRKLAAKYAG